MNDDVVEIIGPNFNADSTKSQNNGFINDRGEIEFQGQDQLLLELERDKFNTYATSKSVSQNLLNTAVITQYVGIMINLFKIRNASSGFTGFQIALLVFICFSFTLQALIFVLLVILSKSTREKVGRCCTTTTINAWVTTLTGLSTIITIVITTLSVQIQSESPVFNVTSNGF